MYMYNYGRLHVEEFRDYILYIPIYDAPHGRRRVDRRQVFKKKKKKYFSSDRWRLIAIFFYFPAKRIQSSPGYTLFADRKCMRIVIIIIV